MLVITLDTHCVSPNVALLQFGEAVTFRVGLDDFLEDEVHPGVAGDKMAIKGFAILKFNKHRLANSLLENA